MDDFELDRFCIDARPRLVGLLGLYCGDAGVAEELAHETLARVCQRWDQVKTMESPQAWTFKVAMNLASSYFRRKAAERRAKERLGALQEAAPEPSSDWSITVREAVAALPRRQRTALLLRYYLDLPVVDTARLMGCAEGTVKALTFKAIASLRIHPALKEVGEVTNAG